MLKFASNFQMLDARSSSVMPHIDLLEMRVPSAKRELLGPSLSSLQVPFQLVAAIKKYCTSTKYDIFNI